MDRDQRYFFKNLDFFTNFDWTNCVFCEKIMLGCYVNLTTP